MPAAGNDDDNLEAPIQGKTLVFSHLDSQLAPLKPANGQCSPSSIRRPTMRPHESGTGMRNQPSTVQPGCGADGKVAMASAAGIKKVRDMAMRACMRVCMLLKQPTAVRGHGLPG